VKKSDVRSSKKLTNYIVSFAVWYSYGINTKVFLYEEKRRKQERRLGQRK